LTVRDLILTLVFLALIIPAIKRPWLCILIWAWFSYMNPHRLCWGFAATFPFAAITAGVTVAALFISGEPKRIPWTRETLLLMLFVLWMSFTTLFALNPQGAWPYWNQTIKIQFMTFLTLMAMTSRWSLQALVWVIVLSLGYFGVKGGIFAVLTGGNYMVQGPEDTFIGGNNEIALALVMVLPLMRYLQLVSENKKLRMALGAAQALTATAVLATYSRAGFLALAVVGLLLLLKSRRKIVLGLAVAAIIPLLLAFMPQKWFDRMHTINKYEQDASAMGRINAWGFAWNLASDRPITGGGFKAFTRELFHTYAPDPDNHHDAHSIYFQVLAEQGFPGLIMFLGLGCLTWRTGSWVTRHTKELPDLQWAGDLSAMTQVSMAGYAVGGAFASLAYFDLPYHLLAIVVLCKTFVKQAAEEPAPDYWPDSGQDTPVLPPAPSFF
jgi:probable O-glycosylation ligase (exosortase A-associated)